MIKHVIFDIGNVCVTFQPVTFFLHHFQDLDKTKCLCAQVFQHEAWDAYDQGLITIAEVSQIYHEVYPKDIMEIDYIIEHWMELMEEIPSTIRLMKQLKAKGIQRYALSNISEDSEVYLRKNKQFFTYLDGGVYSWREQMNKPDSRIYECLLHRYQCKAEECIFIDDLVENVEAARNLGMKGIVYETKEQVEKSVFEMIEEGSSVC